MGYAVATVVLIILVSIFGTQSMFTVDETQLAVVTRFGQIKRIHTTPGLKFKVPFIDSKSYFDKRLLRVDLPENELPDIDTQFLNIDAYARYRILDVRTFRETLRDQSIARARIESIVASNLRQVVAKSKREEIIGATSKTVVATVTEPDKEISLEAARRLRPNIILGDRVTVGTNTRQQILDKVLFISQKDVVPANPNANEVQLARSPLGDNNGDDIINALDLTLHFTDANPSIGPTRVAIVAVDAVRGRLTLDFNFPDVVPQKDRDTLTVDYSFTEDLNNNGLLDLGEDFNNNGELDLAIPVTGEDITSQAIGSETALGIQIVDVRIKRADFPEETQQAIFTRMRSDRKRLSDRFRAEGQQERDRKEADVDRQVAVILSEANRDADITRSEGEAERIRLLAQSLGKDPEFFSFRRSLEAYQKFLSQQTTLVLSSEEDLFQFLDSSQARPSPQQSVLVGSFDSALGNQWLVDGQRVALDGNTNMALIALPVAGDTLFVEGLPQPDGSILATSISNGAMGRVMEIRGTDTTDNNEWLLSGFEGPILVGPDTDVEFGAEQVGLDVQVGFQLQDDGPPLALFIRVG